jgi:O-antigen ligase
MTLRDAGTAAYQTLRGTRRSPSWPMVCVLLLVVASEYKVRLRADDDAISGNADPFVLLEMAAYGVVALFLFLKVRPSVRLNRANWLVFLGYAYAAVVTVSALYSPYFSLAVVRAAQLVIMLALARSIVRHGGRAAMHQVAHACTVLVAASVVFGVLVPFPRLPTQPDRFTWLYLHPVAAGQFTAIAVVLLTAYVFGANLPRPGPRWPIWIYLVMLGVCSAGLLATQTRGAVLGAAVGVLAVIWTRWRGSRKIEVGVVLAIVLAAVALTSSSAIESFFARGESTAQLASLNSRTELWQQALALFPQHPLYGFGLSSTRGLFLETIGLGGGHNALINLLVDTGVLGALTWLALLAGILLAAARITALDSQLWMDRIVILSLLLSLITSSVFAESLGAPANVACAWLFLLWSWADAAWRERTTGLSTAYGITGPQKLAAQGGRIR